MGVVAGSLPTVAPLKGPFLAGFLGSPKPSQDEIRGEFVVFESNYKAQSYIQVLGNNIYKFESGRLVAQAFQA